MINKKTMILLGIKLWLVGVMLLTGRALYDQLPEPTPRHRNIEGQVDGYWTRMGVVLGIPLIVLAMIVLFRFLPKLDPKKANYPKFAHVREIIQFSIIGFMVYAHIVSLLISIHPEYNINSFMLSGIGILFIVMGNYMGKIKHNFFVGVKTPRTIANETVRNKTHRLSWRLRVIAGIIFILQSIIQTYITEIFIITIAITVIVPMVYSYIVFKKIEK
jgi:uncharacterized membrane protein